MKCTECGGTFRKRSGTLEFTDRYAGRFAVGIVDYHKCDDCGELLFSPDVARKVEEARGDKLRLALLNRPLGAFVSGTEAAELLGITRQAFHKHRRIRRGFIFQVAHGGKMFYLRESVARFKQSGDGRFPLYSDWTPPRYTANVEPIAVEAFSGWTEKPYQRRNTGFTGTYGTGTMTERCNV